MVIINPGSPIIIGISKEKLKALDDLGILYNLNPLLLRTFEGNFRLQLRHLNNYRVSVSDQRVYDRLMQVYECGGLEWHSGKSPTDVPFIVGHGSLYISCEQNFSFLSDCCSLAKFKKIVPSEFYHLQNITPEMNEEINQWFEKYKPDRASKGKENNSPR